MRRINKCLAAIVILPVLFTMGACNSGAEKTEALSEEQITEETLTEDTSSEETVSEVAEETSAEEAESELEENTMAIDENATRITYVGHATVKIVANDGTVVYVDPAYYQGDYSDEADYILVTHNHEDHKPCNKVKLKEGGTTITNREALHDGIYESFDFGNIQVEAVPAGNQNHEIEYCVGYIITVDGISIYHAGDTSTLDTMSELASKQIDYAFYPIDGKFNMDAVEATAVAETVGAKVNIPIHEFDNHEVDPSVERKSDKFTPSGAMVLEYGETINITKQW